MLAGIRGLELRFLVQAASKHFGSGVWHLGFKHLIICLVWRVRV